MNKETKAGNIRMAEFMGYPFNFAATQYYQNGQHDKWNPDKDLNQLFDVVDKIRNKTGWEFEVLSYGTRHRSTFISDRDPEDIHLYTQVIIIDNGFSREAAIYTAVLAALDHIENQ